MTQHDSKIDKIYSTLDAAGKKHTSSHSKRVCQKAIEICNDSKLNSRIELACALHDISVIVPKDNWAEFCEKNGISLIKEETELPVLIHQKLSRYLAEHQFNITDGAVLSAVECHTTLKPDATYFDTLIFIADKIAWDGEGLPPWHEQLCQGLKDSVYSAAFNYMDYCMKNSLFMLPHPQLLRAYGWLKEKTKP